MRILWQIDSKDIERVRAFYKQYEHNRFVLERWKCNVINPPTIISKDEFWYTMIECLLTTQQRSGPESAVMKFVKQRPFPLSYEFCLKTRNLEGFCEETIRQFGGIRRGKKIGQAAHENLARLEAGTWKEVFTSLEQLGKGRSPADERRVARLIDARLAEFGPKQSRNLLQTMGVTRYEIPVDSRIIKWLNRFDFPVKVDAKRLQNEDYYCFVLDGVQALCRECAILPCMLDAAIFVSFDAKAT